MHVSFVNKHGGKGFVGIEVKYHESLNDAPAPHRSRYDEIADAMGAFKGESRDKLKDKPLQQVWRDHLLAGSLLLDREAGFDDGFFVVLYPKENDRCATAVEAYRGCLTDEKTFTLWTLENVVAAIKAAGAGAWVGAFEERYLAFGRVGDE